MHVLLRHPGGYCTPLDKGVLVHFLMGECPPLRVYLPMDIPHALG